MSEFAVLLSPSENYAVVQLPGRRFPGIVFQGDSAQNILRQLTRIQQLAGRYRDCELDAEVGDLRELFASFVKKYESCCEAHALQLPYPKS